MNKENRRQARIQAAQRLYACEMRQVLVPGAAVTEPSDEELLPFARTLADSALERLPEVDRLLVQALQNWDLHRLGAVDRAVLRLAVVELMTQPDIPAAVTINEAIEIARTLASAESARFANGVLDRVRKELGRDPRATQAP